MELSTEMISEKMENFLKLCKKNKVKITPQRIEIFKALAATDEHPGVDEIYNRIRLIMPNVSKDTVYRTLALFEEMGAAIKVEQLCERVRYDADVTEHQHFLCERCGGIKDFHFSGLRKLFKENDLSEVGEVKSMVLQLRGTCKDCLNNN